MGEESCGPCAHVVHEWEMKMHSTFYHLKRPTWRSVEEAKAVTWMLTKANHTTVHSISLILSFNFTRCRQLLELRSFSIVLTCPCPRWWFYTCMHHKANHSTEPSPLVVGLYLFSFSLAIPLSSDTFLAPALSPTISSVSVLSRRSTARAYITKANHTTVSIHS